MKFRKTWVGGKQICRTQHGKPKTGRRENKKIVVVFFLIFTFISLAIMATNTVGLGSLVKKYFSKVVVPDISKPWSHHTDFLVFFLSFLNLGCPFFVSA